ncbi:MAG TPA: hypothetical protein VMF59_04730 [Bacteroidota bacterium]|nr:hypothetical protein [Bacteroidota bacterium]
MREFPKISSVAFASLFLLFNVGLPILIDACPMPRPVGSMMCAMCRDDGGEPGREVLKGKPCCAPSLAAERNTSEFLTVQKILCDRLALSCTLVYTASPVASSLMVSQTFSPVPSHFAPDDIPVVHSSLLI